MMVTCEWQFLLSDIPDDADLPAHAEALMNELLALEACNESLVDSAVGLDVAEAMIEISVTAIRPTFEEAIADAMTAIRAAIHASGGSTADWPQGLPSEEDALQYEPKGMHALV